MKIFVTGFHRAGTHTAAEYFARKHGLLYLSEERVRWDSMDAVKLLCEGKSPKWEPVDGKWTLRGYHDPMIAKGFVLQCPGLAHKTLELATMGKVYWTTRNRLDKITAMRNAGISDHAWHLMKGFRQEFPGDPIWSKLTYDGSEDNHYGFVKYLSLLCSVKEYFYQTKFKDYCELVQLELRSYYNKEKTLTRKKPLKEVEKQRAMGAIQEHESISVC